MGLVLNNLGRTSRICVARERLPGFRPPHNVPRPSSTTYDLQHLWSKSPCLFPAISASSGGSFLWGRNSRAALHGEGSSIARRGKA